jgi:hypothetical protein
VAIVFSSKGAGTNLIRATTAAGRVVQIKTGHAFYRAHKGPGGAVIDLRTSGLTPDEIETEIVQDIEKYLVSGGAFPQPGKAGFTGPASRTVTVKGVALTYRAVQSPGGMIDVPTYF